MKAESDTNTYICMGHMSIHSWMQCDTYMHVRISCRAVRRSLAIIRAY